MKSICSGVARVIVSGGGGKLRAPKVRAILGGSGGMLPRKILKSRVPQMRFPAFSGSDFAEKDLTFDDYT